MLGAGFKRSERCDITMFGRFQYERSIAKDWKEERTGSLILNQAVENWGRWKIIVVGDGLWHEFPRGLDGDRRQGCGFVDRL